jgi:hypothetical protein
VEKSCLKVLPFLEHAQNDEMVDMESRHLVARVERVGTGGVALIIEK